VTPFGDVVALAGRGLVLGNRGILHDDHRTIVRPWQVRRWIACRLEWKGIRRVVMRPHRYTELFFLDEATAFAAGHRPCAECRNADYRRFKSLWQACFGEPVSAETMDDEIHAHRLQKRQKVTYRCELDDLPDGTFVALDGRAWLVLDSELLAWSDRGYDERRARPVRTEVEVLTPRPIVEVIKAGYVPDVHPTAALA
jgi:hypothetical protein